MNIGQYFAAHHDHLFYLIAGISFVVELTVMGLSGPLLFFAIGSFLTAIFVSLGLIGGWEIEIFCLGISTGLIALLLWRPLKNFQNSGGGSDESSDMIGRHVLVSSEISLHGGTVRYSGINWNSRLKDGADVSMIAEGQYCAIVAVDGNVMLVEPLK
jgi:membrane protein implicated in regulation of membrane protease activity